MKAFQVEQGIVVPIDRANVDTDMIIPKQFLKSILRSGFGPNLFDELRYLDKGEPGQDNSKRPLNMDFELNMPRYKGASILLARKNFGCGSSREHAPWALDDFGIRAVIAPSFADIFFNNCYNNGILPVVLAESVVDNLFARVAANEGYQLTIDLAAQTLITPEGESYAFDIDANRKHRLLNGLDDIGITLKSAESISAYEQQWRQKSPWLFDNIK